MKLQIKTKIKKTKRFMNKKIKIKDFYLLKNKLDNQEYQSKAL